MPLSYYIDEDEDVITIQGDREVAFAQFQAMATEMFSDTRYLGSMPQMIDLRSCSFTLPTRSIAAIGRYVAKNYAQNVSGPIAVVINDTLDRRAIAWLYRLTVAVPGAELFEDYGAAVRWLVKKSGVKRPH